MAVKIVTDSVADLPPQVVEELAITVIPLHVCFGTEVYRDGVDLTTVLPVQGEPGGGDTCRSPCSSGSCIGGKGVSFRRLLATEARSCQ